jgi:hypothetical protein
MFSIVELVQKKGFGLTRVSFEEKIIVVGLTGNTNMIMYKIIRRRK